MGKEMRKRFLKFALFSALIGVVGSTGNQIITPIVVYACEEDGYLEIPNLILTEEEIVLANEYLEEQDFLNQNFLNEKSLTLSSRAVVGGLIGWAGTFLIPGVGQVVITAAGAILVGGVAVSVGSWLGQKVKNWIYTSKKNDAEKAAAKVPTSLKKSNGNVDTGKFTEKVKGRSAWKDPKTGWVIEKDTANHYGYDGTQKKWKIFDKKGNRVGSLNGAGKVVDK